MTTPLQITRYDRLVRRAMNLVGEGAIVTGVLPDVFPIIDLEQLPPELRAIGGWRLGFAGQSFTAAAAEFPTLIVANPTDSGILTVVTTAIVSSTVADRINWRVISTVGTGALVNQFRPRDTRSAANLTTQLRQVSGVAPVPLGSTSRLGAADPLHILNGDSFVLFPQSQFEVGGLTAQGTILVAFAVMERQFEQSELI